MSVQWKDPPEARTNNNVLNDQVLTDLRAARGKWALIRTWSRNRDRKIKCPQDIELRWYTGRDVVLGGRFTQLYARAKEV